LYQKLLVLILLLALSPALYAGETGYEVELIIFEDTSNRYLDSENWRYNDKLNKKEGVKKLKSTKVDMEFSVLDWNESKLMTEFNRLKRSSRYRILATKRWKQTGLDRNQAFDIPINIPEEEAVENDISVEANEPLNTQTQNEPADNTTETLDTDQQAIELPEPTEPYVTGHVKLIMSRYLHFNVDLRYIRPQPPLASDANEQAPIIMDTNNEADAFNQSNTIEDTELTEPDIFSVPIVNERRMRSREIHYIDHPLVGIIVLATPYKIKPPETEPTAPAPYKTM